jgi:FkbM family methyltransferase
MHISKSLVQDALNRAGLYHRAKGSLAYDLYGFMFDRSILDGRRAEMTFYRELLRDFPANGLIFDVGANHGWKTDTFLRLGARVVAVEPDEGNQDVLKQKFLSYRVFKKPVTVVGKALGETNATETMWIDAPGSAKNTLSRKWVETLRVDATRFGETLDFREQKSVSITTLDDLIAAHGRPFFVKIDVEGYEPCVLRGLTQSVPYLSFEVNLPEFRPEGLECVEILKRLHREGTFNYAVDLHDGLVLEEWLDADAFSTLLAGCCEPSVEVFWSTTR